MMILTVSNCGRTPLPTFLVYRTYSFLSTGLASTTSIMEPSRLVSAKGQYINNIAKWKSGMCGEWGSGGGGVAGGILYPCNKLIQP